jgi:hypothetical protein
VATADRTLSTDSGSGGSAGSNPGHSPQAPLAPTLALTVVLAVACFAAVMAIVMYAANPQPIAGLGTTQKQDAETALYVIGFAVILPLALIATPRLADVIAAGPNAASLSSLAAAMTGALGAAVLVARLSGLVDGGGGKAALLSAVGLWAVVAGAALGRAAKDRPWPALLSIGAMAPRLWGVAAALAFGTLLTVTDRGSLSLVALGLGIAVVPAVVVAAERGPRLPLPRRWGVALDGLIVVVLFLALPDLVIITPEDPAASTLEQFVHGVIQFHHDLLLGPTNQVLGGGTMLVDTASQYGVGSIYFLAGWFQLWSIGYGSLGLLDGILTGLTFVAGYCVLRLAGVSRLLAASALAIGVIALVLNRQYPVGALPQEGPLRFGLPMALILATVAGARWPRHARTAHAAAFGMLALSSIWALEAFALTGGTFVGMACFRAHLLPGGGRLQWLLRQALLGAAACAGAHLLLAAATLVGSGELPDWGQYMAFLRAFLVGDLGNVTYDFSRWSPALAVGAAYLASAAALVLLARRSAGVVRRERVALLAIAGISTYGIFLFDYFVDRSADHVLAYVSLPALLVAALWLSVVLRARASLAPGVATGALAFALSVAVLLLAVAWSSVGGRFEQSALAHVIPGGDTPGSALERLWHFPPLNPAAVEGDRLLERHMPGERRSVVLVQPNVATETLMRSGRANQLPLADPWEDSFVADERVPGLRAAVAGLRAGDRLLLDEGMLAGLAMVRADPDFGPLEPAAPGSAAAPLQLFTLQEIHERFRLRPIHRSPLGFVVVELAERD